MLILFVCTGNTCRSLIAEQVARRMIEERGLSGQVEVRSAGISASSGGRAPENTIRVLRQAGIDLTHHTTTPLDKEMVEEADLILAMDQGHVERILNRFPTIKRKVFLLNEFAGLGKKEILDPIGCSFEAYETCLEQIRKGLLGIIERIRKGDLGGQ
jgi:protein-tyrosine-phosphatase